MGINEKLLTILDAPEIAAVIMHEIGHMYYYNHVRFGILG